MSLHAILGASGKVGLATLTELVKAQIPVRAILHNESKSAQLQSMGCDIAIADLHNADSLTQGLNQADAVQVILPLDPHAGDPVADMRQQIENIVIALTRTQPKRLLVISDYGAHVSHDIGIPSIFHALEARLSVLDCHKTFLRSAEQMENLARALPAVLAAGKLSTFEDPTDAQFPTVSAQDVGFMAAKLLMSSDNDNMTHICHIEGPRRYSMDHVAEALSQLLGQNIVAEAIPRARWQNILGGNVSSGLERLLTKTNDAKNRTDLIDIEPGSSNVQHGDRTLKDVLQDLLSYLDLNP